MIYQGLYVLHPAAPTDVQADVLLRVTATPVHERMNLIHVR